MIEFITCEGNCDTSRYPDSRCFLCIFHRHPTWVDLWWSHRDVIVVSFRISDLNQDSCIRQCSPEFTWIGLWISGRAASFPEVSYQTFSAAALWSVSWRASHWVWTHGFKPHTRKHPATQFPAAGNRVEGFLNQTPTLTFLTRMSVPSRSTLGFAGCYVNVSHFDPPVLWLKMAVKEEANY